MKYTINLFSVISKQLEVIQEVVLSEASNLNELSNEQKIRREKYIVPSRNKILEKNALIKKNNGFISLLLLPKIFP